MTQLANLGITVNAGLADHRHACPQTRRQLAGAVKVDREIAQVAVINAHHFCLQSDGALQLLFVAHLGQHAHVQAVCDGSELAVLFIIQHREHQQAGIGLIKARQPDLIRIDNKVFAQNRLWGDPADDRQEIKTALEIFLIGQHRNGRSVVLINGGNLCRIEIIADHPFRRGGLFALQDKRGARAPQGVIKTTAARYHLILEAGERLLLFTRFNPDGLIGNDFR